MSVEVRKNSQGEPVYAIRYRDGDGRSRRETLGAKSEGWDKRKARQAERLRLAGLKTGPSIGFKDLAWDWFHASEGNWKPRTLAAYRRAINRMDALWGFQVDEVRPRHVADWILKAGKNYSAKTVNNDISILYQIFEYGIQQEYIIANPAKAAPRPKMRKRKWRILTPEEIRAVDKAFESIEFKDQNGRWDERTARRQAQLMFRVLTRTGIRRDELRNLKVGDIDFDRCVIRIQVSKTEEGERSIAIPKSLATDLKEWCGRPNPS